MKLPAARPVLGNDPKAPVTRDGKKVTFEAGGFLHDFFFLEIFTSGGNQ